MTNYNDGNWHGWNGGECPVHPKTEVEAVLRDRQIAFDGVECAGKMHWSVDPMRLYPRDIIAFRVVKEHRGPRDFWIKIECGTPMITRTEPIMPHSYIHVREVTE